MAAALPLTACQPPALPVAVAVTLPAGKLALGAGLGGMEPDTPVANHRALKIWSTATATGAVHTPFIVQIAVRVRGDQCQGAPVMSLRVDGVVVGTATVTNSTWRTISFDTSLRPGSHRIALAFTNDHAIGSCDRNLWLDWVQFDEVDSGSPKTSPAPRPARPTPSRTPSPTPTPTPSPTSTSAADSDPFSGATLYVDPLSNAAVAAAATSGVDPTDGALLSKIAGQPQADWFSNGSGEPTTQVSARVSQIATAGATPVLVAYAIPLRDCGVGYSKGGVADMADYHTWITQFAAGIAGRRAVVILEPDALAQLDCLSTQERTDRIAMLKDAIKVLTASPATAVYLDAGNSSWHGASVMAARLESVGLTHVRGFSLNVSGFDDTSSEEIYGESITALTGKHYIVDVSRNGNGNGSGTCNPAGRALGERPTVTTSAPNADALLWVKRPGESDGDCGSGDPAAGVWSAALAEDLASRAAW